VQSHECFVRRLAIRFAHTVLGTLLGTSSAVFTRSFERKEKGKATVLLTAASAAREINPLCA
jgi:hypothetical protein